MADTNFRNYDQRQGLFTPIVPADLLEDEHPARVIDAVVENLDLSRIYARYSDQGNPSYHPKMMFKVLFYSYYRGIMSSRKMNASLHSGRADFIFLSGKQMPDFRTLNDFRTRHIDELPNLFAQIVLFCESLDMIDFEHLAIDGQKIQADANFRKSMNRERLDKRIEQIEKAMEKIVKTPVSEAFPKEKRQRRLNDLEEKYARIVEFAEIFKLVQGEKGDDHAVNMTDPDAPVMSHKDGRSVPSYNHQSAVDSKFGVTCAVRTKVDLDQQSDVLGLVNDAERNAGGEIFGNVTADSAFGGMDLCRTIAEEKRQENLLIPDKQFEAWKKGKLDAFDSCYFLRCDDDRLICPAGHDVDFVGRTGEHGLKYVGTCCDECEHRGDCTSSDFRTVVVDDREIHVSDMRAKLNTEEGKEIYRSRQGIVENGHGHDQKNLGWKQHALRGLPKAGGEFILMRIGANLGKIARYRPAEALAFCAG